MIVHHTDFSPMKLGHDRHTTEMDVPVIRPVNDRLTRLRARLAEAEAQRERAFDALEQAGNDPFLHRVYLANAAYVHRLQQEVRGGK